MFNDDTTEDEVIEETEVEQEEEVTEEEEDTTDWKAVALEEKAKREKAEQTIIKAKQKPKVQSNDSGLSASDIIALSKANIEAEDLDEVLDWATYKKIPIVEALKSTALKATLAEKAEIRASANAVNTGSTRRATNAVSDERLLSDARSGKMPESASDIAKLVQARLSKK